MSGAQDTPGLGSMPSRERLHRGSVSGWNRGSQGQRGGRAAAERHGAVYAALDLGTNNCRLLVARPTSDAFRVVDAFSRIIRLGEGVTSSGRISEAAIARAVDALSVCRDKMKLRGVTRARLIATEACRTAENGELFRQRIVDQVGLELDIINRETEATLAAVGCTPLIDPRASGVVLFDIGGGSSELVRLGTPQPTRGGPPPPQIDGWVSMPYGVVTLAERYGGQNVSVADYEAMVEEVGTAVRPFADAHRGCLDGVHLLGTSGTVTTIAGVHLALERYERRRVDGCWMSADEMREVVRRLLEMSYEERVASPCIGRERADLVLAGCAILEAICRAFPCPRLRVADRGLREGMLVSLMREDGVWDRASAS